MKIARLYSKNGKSYLGEMEIDLERINEIEEMSKEIKGKVIFNKSKAGHFYDYHNAPRKQFVVTLSGKIKVNAENKSQVFEKGDILLAEDMEGKGHTTEVLEEWICMYIPIVFNSFIL